MAQATDILTVTEIEAINNDPEADGFDMTTPPLNIRGREYIKHDSVESMLEALKENPYAFDENIIELDAGECTAVVEIKYYDFESFDYEIVDFYTINYDREGQAIRSYWGDLLIENNIDIEDAAIEGCIPMFDYDYFTDELKIIHEEIYQDNMISINSEDI